MAQVDTYFRDVFNSPQLWKDVRIRVPDKRIDGRALRIFRIRGIAALDIRNKHFELRQETTLQISHLETLSLHVTRVNTLRALCQAASSGHLKLKNLAFGRIDDRIGRQSEITFLELFKNLTTMEGVSFGNDWTDCFPYEEGKTCVPLTKETQNPLAADLRQALCCTGKLKSISLIYLSEVGRSWLNTVVTNNPNLQALSLTNIESFTGEGIDEVADPTVFSNLRTFSWRFSSRYMRTANTILSWAFPGTETNENLTSLDVSRSSVHEIFPLLRNFPSLRRLNLTGSVIPLKNLSLQSLPTLHNLEWLELKHFLHIANNQLLVLSDRVGKALRYLGLAKQPLVEDSDLRDLATMFPVLKTLDLSECHQITDALLVEWYIKHSNTEWPKLRKLVLKGCKEITQEVVDSVRLKTRNQLLIDL